MAENTKKYYCYWIVSGRRNYFGATVDLKRRLRMHNSEIKGGSCRTCGRGPWRYMCTFEGFRSWHEALCFEWRAQYDTKRCRSVETIKVALENLMKRERWTKNSPLSKDVPLVVKYEPTEYGFPPENYEEIKPPPAQRRNAPGRKKYKRLYGTY